MSPPTPTNKRQDVLSDPSPGRRHNDQKSRGNKVPNILGDIVGEAQSAINARGTSISPKNISDIQKDKNETQVRTFQQKWIFGRTDSPGQDVFDDKLTIAARTGAQTGTEAAIKKFVGDRYKGEPTKAYRKTEDLLRACTGLREHVVVKQTDGKKYAMNLVDVIRPVIDPKFKSLLREKIGDETFKALKETYSTNVTPGTQAQFDNEFKELIGTNGGNDKITAQVMHEFAMQAKLEKISGSATDNADATMTGTHGTNGASGST